MDRSIVCGDACRSLELGAELLCSKKSKIQSNSLAGAIIEGLMPITAEPEVEDVDEDAPSRVRGLSIVLSSIN